MSKKYLKSTDKICIECGSRAGLLLITLPRDRFLLPRAAAQEKFFSDKIRAGVEITSKDRWVDKKARTVRLCPTHIKAYQKRYKTTNTHEMGKKVKNV